MQPTVFVLDKARRALSLAFASWEVGMRERERVWWNDRFVRRTEGDELFGFGVYRVCRIVQRKMGTSHLPLVFSLFELFFPSSSFRDSRFPLLPPATHARESQSVAGYRLGAFFAHLRRQERTCSFLHAHAKMRKFQCQQDPT